MKVKLIFVGLLFSGCVVSFSCESERKQTHKDFEELEVAEWQQKKNPEGRRNSERLEEERSKQERISEEKRKEKEIYYQYIDNSLPTGSTPWAEYYGENSPCEVYGCSKIKITTPRNSDVIVTIKKDHKVVDMPILKLPTAMLFLSRMVNIRRFSIMAKAGIPKKK